MKQSSSFGYDHRINPQIWIKREGWEVPAAEQQEKFCYANVITKLQHSYQAWHYYFLEKYNTTDFLHWKEKIFIFHCNAAKWHPSAV